MEMSTSISPPSKLGQPWQFFPRHVWMWLGLSSMILAFLYWDSLGYLFQIWSTDENFGHGFFVPVISGYLIWQQRGVLFGPTQGKKTWLGFGIVMIALFLYFIGEFSTIYFLLHLSFWLMLCGLAVALLGWKGVKSISFPLFFLLTMIPLPQFFLQSLSAKLQLFSSWLGVECLRLVGVLAFRDGNVIDLGPIQLQVVEACSGLRALFPLMTLALICAYFLKGPLWKRLVLFLSSMPIAIVLNGVRIGMVGFLVEEFGVGAAEGFYHFFEGWVLFVVSLAVLLVEMWILSQGNHETNASSAATGSPGQSSCLSSGMTPVGSRSISKAYVCSVLILAPVLLASTYIVDRQENVPIRKAFLDFPMQVDEWKGHSFPMKQIYIDTLRFDDYLLADYQRGTEPPVNLYLAYYRSQKKGRSVHSPSTCLPGGGWEIKSMETLDLEGMESNGSPLRVNRVLIHKGEHRQLVYYWFLQRGRILTNEYLVKGYLFWDTLMRNRSDGGLIRLTIPVSSESNLDHEEDLLREFVKSVNPFMTQYIPD